MPTSRRFRRVSVWALAALALVLILATVAVIVLTTTPWGRDQVRAIVVQQVGEIVDGELEVEGIGGNLLGTFTVEGVRLRDREGRPFLAADTVTVAYDLRSLARRRVVLTRLDLHGIEVVLDQPPGEEWNFLRIFPTEEEPDPAPPDPEGWGSWLEVQNATVQEARVILRTPWEPDPDLPPELRDERRRQALAGDGPAILEEVPGGVQQVMGFHPDHGALPRILVAHPHEPAPSLRVASLEGRAQIFRGPPAEITGLSGYLDLSGEEMILEGVELSLPGSRLSAEAWLEPETGEGEVRLTAEPVTLSDLHFLQPDLPHDVEGDLEGWVRLAPPGVQVRVPELDLRVGAGRISGRVEVELDGFVERFASDLQVRGLETRFLEELFPDMALHRHATLSGHLVATPLDDAAAPAGEPTVHRVDLLVDVHPEEGSRSRILAEGAVRPSPLPQDTEFSGLVVTADPLQWDAITALVPDFPGEGRLEGQAMLDGTLSGVLQLESEWALVRPEVGEARLATEGGVAVMGGLAFHGFGLTLEPTDLPVLEPFTGELPVAGSVAGGVHLDGPLEEGMEFAAHVEHRYAEADSRVEAQGEWAMAEGVGGWIEAELMPLSFAPFGGEGGVVPVLDPAGEATGRLEIRGTLQDLGAQVELDVAGDGRLLGTGRMDGRGDEPEVQAALEWEGVDLSALTRITEVETDLRGSLEASMVGLEMESTAARLSAELEDHTAPGPRALTAELALEEGLLEIHPVILRLPSTRTRVEGTLGLIPEQVGALSYEMEVDSLAALAPFLPEPEAGLVEPRPLVRATAAEARRDQLLEGARSRQVEFLATGEEPEVPAPADTLLLAGIRRDALRGSIRAEGSVGGHLGDLRVEGVVEAGEVLAMGQRLDHLRADHVVEGIGTASPRGSGELRLERLQVEGFFYDHMALEADYRGEPEEDGHTTHAGTLAVRLQQDPATSIATSLQWELARDSATALLDHLVVELPDTELRTVGPASVLWDPRGLAIRDFHLREASPADLDPSPQSDDPSQLDQPPQSVEVDGFLPRELDGEEEGALDVRVQAFDAGHVLELLQLRDDVRARVGLDLPLRGSLASPEMEAGFSVRGARFQDRELPEVRMSLHYREREAQVDGEVLERETGDRALGLEGRFPVDLALLDGPEDRLLPGPIEGRVRLDSMDLAVVATLVDGVESTVGVADGEVRLSGSFQDPVLEGGVQAELPSALVEPTGVRYRDGAASFTFDGGIMRVDSMVVWSRGPLRVEGEVGIPGLADPEMDLRLQARNARIMDTRDLSLQVDADLEAAGPFDGLRVTGSARARRGVIRIPETEELAEPGPLALEDPATFAGIDDLRLLALRDALIQPSPFLEHLELALDVHVDREVWLRSRETNIEFRTLPEVGPLRVELTGIDPQNLRLDGTIGSDRGEYAFMGRRFDLSRASIIFTPETTFDPLIRLVAEHAVQMAGREGFDIRIIVDGSLTELDTELESTSQPPLSETDLLSFMVFGQEAGSLLRGQGSGLVGQGSAGGPLVGAVAARAAQSFATVGMDALVAELEAEVARSLGLDVIHIVPAELPTELSTGEFGDLLRGTEVEAGAYLTPRLFVSGQARPTFVHPGARVEYQTEHGWLLRSTFRPRFLPAVPTLSEVRPDRVSVLGVLILREWRF